MARTKSLAWPQLKIGIIGVVAILMASMLILAVGGQAGFWWERYTLKTRFANAAGMKPGAVVRLAGKDIGKVTAVDFAGREIEIGMDIHEDVKPLITTESRASMGSLSLLGEPIVEISAATSGTPLASGSYVPSTPASGSIAEVAATAQTTLGEANKLLLGITEGKGSVGKLFTDEQLYADTTSLVNAAEAVVRDMQRGKGTLGQLAQNPAAYKSLEASLRNLDAVTSRINRGEGSLGRLLNDDAMAKSISSASANMDAITGRLNRGEGTAGKLLTDDALFTRMTELTSRFEKLAAGLEKGEGTAGALLKDKQLYENMTKTMGELSGLVAEIRKDPKKYLNIRVSIF
ncbi:MAG: MlaD family protein [Acidobacteriota bacterium]|nr:MlaD family protein [Acidobacteriota bacterium]MDQ3170992.1 MlaD family protein [Acidobacteriota bacterium]